MNVDSYFKAPLYQLKLEREQMYHVRKILNVIYKFNNGQSDSEISDFNLKMTSEMFTNSVFPCYFDRKTN
jgi:hypothetical protein